MANCDFVAAYIMSVWNKEQINNKKDKKSYLIYKHDILSAIPFLFHPVLPEINVNITVWNVINSLNQCLESISTEQESLNRCMDQQFFFFSY